MQIMDTAAQNMTQYPYFWFARTGRRVSEPLPFSIFSSCKVTGWEECSPDKGKTQRHSREKDDQPHLSFPRSGVISRPRQ